MRAIKRPSVYIDICALGRPYDDQDFPRIEAETAAVVMITALIKASKYLLYYSIVHEMEIAGNPNDIERAEISKLLMEYGKSTGPLVWTIYPEIEKRAFKFE